MKKFLRYISYFILTIVILLITIALLLQSNYGKNKIKDIALAELNKAIHGQLIINDLSGNLISHIELNDVVLINKNDTLAAIDQIKLNYKIKQLFFKEIHLDTLQISSPHTNLIMENDSVWNFSKAFSFKKKQKKQSNNPFLFKIKAESIQVTNGSVQFTTTKNLIPKKISHINISMSGKMQKDEIMVNLHHLSLITEEPNLVIKELSLDAALINKQLSVNNLLLKTNKNAITANGKQELNNAYTANLNSDPFHLSEFNFFIPTLYFKSTPKIKINTSLLNDTLQLNAHLIHQNETLDIKATLYKFDPQNIAFTNYPFTLKLTAKNMEVSNWGLKKDLPIILNGYIEAQGNSLNFSRDPIQLNAQLNHSTAYNFSPDTLILKASYSPRQSFGKIDVRDIFGKSSFNFKLDKNGNIYSYEVNAAMSNIQLDSLIPPISPTNINLNANITGQGFNPDNMKLNATLKLSNSIVRNINIDSLDAKLNLKNGIASFDSLYIFNNNELIKVNAKYKLKDKYISGEFSSVLNNLNDIYPYIKDSLITSTASLNGHFLGQTDSVTLTSDFLFSSPQRENIKADKIEGNLKLYLTKDFGGLINLNASNLTVNEINIDSTYISSRISRTEFTNYIELSNKEDFNMQCSSIINTNNNSINIAIPNLKFETPEITLKNKHKDLNININNNSYTFNRVELENISDKEFILKIDGVYQPYDQSNIDLIIKNFNLSMMNKWLKKEQLSGLLHVKTNLKGLGNNPSLTSSIKIDSLKYNLLAPPLIRSEISIENQYLDGTLYFSDRFNNSINASINFPLLFNLQEYKIEVKEDFPISGKLICNEIDIHKYMRENTAFTNTKGIVSFDISVNGSNKKPDVNGYFKVSDGGFSYPKYGIEYKNIKTKVSISKDFITLDSLYLKGGEGYLLATGKANIDSSIFKGQLDIEQINLRAKNFHLSKAKAHDITINSNIQVKNENNIPTYSGGIDVSRSSFYLPDLLKLNTAEEIQNEPLLVQAITQNNTDSILISESITAANSLQTNHYLPTIDNLKGNLKITIPKNTWIKSEELKLEISGDIDLVKSSKSFELLGEITILRGNYYLYGRRFNLLKGEITFTGGEKFEPILNIEAEYVFRGADKDVETLKLLITGTPDEPDINFLHDNNSINESEAISYIIYNRSSDEIGYDNQKGLASAVSSGIMSKMVSSQLNKTIGNKLNLDMIELNTEDNWQSMDFVVGKYITNDLFVIYQKGFGENNNNEITPESITLEYEILKNLFIQLQSGNSNTSGVDIILKFERQNL